MKLGEILVKQGVLTDEQLKDSLFSQNISQQRLGEILVEKGYCTEKDIASSIAGQLNLPFIGEIKPDKLLNEKVGPDFLYREICVFCVFNGEKYVACTSLNEDVVEKIALSPDLKGVKIGLSTKFLVYDALNSIFMGVKKDSQNAEDVLSQCLEIAISKNSSNVRIKRVAGIYLIQIDTNAGLEAVKAIKLEQGKMLINILAKNCGVTLKQGNATDAKFLFESKLYKDLKINIRLEFLPVSSRLDSDPMLFEAVLRLHGLSKVFKLEALGFNDAQTTMLKEIYTYPHGFVIATGPTGSGKTTTFYALLKLLAEKRRAIFSIEDPVEIELKEPNITQMNIQEGFGYAEALKAMLRSEPHIIMIGEIRDQDTAKHALEAAETGHLVLTTLHTNSALSILERLKTLGSDIHGFLDSVRLVTGQRLYSPLCPKCKTKISFEELPAHYRKSLENSWKLDDDLFVNGFHSRGIEPCDHCGGTGYVKKKAILEIAIFTDDIKSKIKSLKSYDSDSIRYIFQEEGFKSLKVLAGEALSQGLIDISQYFIIAG